VGRVLPAGLWPFASTQRERRAVPAYNSGADGGQLNANRTKNAQHMLASSAECDVCATQNGVCRCLVQGRGAAGL